MQIEKKPSQSTLPLFPAKSGATQAQDQASLFQARLALARWTRGGDIPHVHASERQMPMRAAWYEQAEQHFQAWLEAGGFHQAEHLCLDCAALRAANGDADEPAASAFPAPGIGSWPAPEDRR